VQPRISYFVCATPRSGSTLLCEALTHTGLAGKPKEYFEASRKTGLPPRPGDYFKDSRDAGLLSLVETLNAASSSAGQQAVISFADYLARVLEEGVTPNGVFGTKIMWGQLEDFVHSLRELPGCRESPIPQLFSDKFPNLHYIYISRRDKVQQAVSLWRAIQTWTWRQKKASSSTNISAHSAREPIFHYEAIDYLIHQLNAHDEAWQQYFEQFSLHPYVVIYEELVEAYATILQGILQYLSIRPPELSMFAQPPMERQADTLSEQWVERYHQHKHSLEAR
jgi:trehalose 2-sulfotransferase